LKLKSGLKNQELSPEQIVGVCSKRLSCVSTESIYQHIWKDKKKGEFVSLRTTGKRYRKEEVKRLRGVLSNRRLIEDRPKIVDLKQRFET
jgi:hypothetical protein